MRRITTTLPDELAVILKDEAARRGTSVSEVVRSSVLQSLAGNERRSLPFASLCDDRDMTRAAHLEQELDRTWGHDLERGRR